MDEWKKYCRESMPPELLHSRCEGCLQHGHSWDLAFSKCLRRRCCYCGNQFRNKRSHPASLCPNRPAETAARTADVDEDRRQPWSEGAVPLQSNDDNDDDGFVSPLKAHVNFTDARNLLDERAKLKKLKRPLELSGFKDEKTTTVLERTLLHINFAPGILRASFYVLDVPHPIIGSDLLNSSVGFWMRAKQSTVIPPNSMALMECYVEQTKEKMKLPETHLLLSRFTADSFRGKRRRWRDCYRSCRYSM